MQLVIDEGIREQNIEDLVPYTSFHEFTKYFTLPAGEEHYRMLSSISHQLAGHTIFDIGTARGYSAIALGHCAHTHVVTYDIVDEIPNDALSIKQKENITFRVKNCLSDISELSRSPFVMLDTSHDGDFEKELILALGKNQYKGVVLCDDIYLNPEMNSFW